MNAEQMWAEYALKNNIDARYEAWAFGDDPDSLAALVLEGTKTATSSCGVWYGPGGEPFPQPGAYSIVLDGRGLAVCIVRTVRVYAAAFEAVSPEHAWKEGEGDRSLAYWRRVHERFFREELAEAGMAFDKTMQVICEEFEKVYP